MTAKGVGSIPTIGLWLGILPGPHNAIVPPRGTHAAPKAQDVDSLYVAKIQGDSLTPHMYVKFFLPLEKLAGM